MNTTRSASEQSSFGLWNQKEWDSLLDQQREYEDEGLADGGRRFKKRLLQAQTKGMSTTAGAAQRLLVHGLAPFEAAIKEWVTVSETKRGVKHIALKWIKLAGIDATAYIALRQVLNYAPLPVNFYLVSEQIADTLLDELRFRRFQDQQPALFRYKLSAFQTSSYAYMARSLNASMSITGIDVTDLKLSREQRQLVGMKLIDLLIESTALVEISRQHLSAVGSAVTVASDLVRSKIRQRRNKKPMIHVQPTEETLRWMDQKNAVLEFLRPTALPMLVPPLQWGPGERGGYRFGLRNKYALARGVSPEHHKTIDHAATPIVYQALNAIQNTAWKINPDVYAACLQIEAAGGNMAKIPALEPEAPPEKPADIAENRVARRQWRKAAHAVIERNKARASKAADFLHTMRMATTLKDRAAFFFPHNLDFRGRVYPIISRLSPQGDDLSRGLLTFAQGKPLGPTGAYWLALYGANCMDKTLEGEKISRMTLEERQAWVNRMSDQIVAVANAPLDHTWWMQADKPMRFLAFCFEWRRYIEQGEEAVCSLPVSIDGTCNGLQHFSALLRDPIGGKAVNVVPQETPQDIYQIVADHVLKQLEAIVAENTEPDLITKEVTRKGKKLTITLPSDGFLAARWLSSGLVDRKLCKRPTMTFGYGSKQYGFQDQLLQYLQKDVESEQLPTWVSIRAHFTPEGSKVQGQLDAVRVMSSCIWAALQEVVIAASQGMEWMQKSARLIAGPVQWRVPSTGFPVRQEYFEMQQRRIKTLLAGTVMRPYAQVPTSKTAAHKQANAIAPNVVHSLDAAALMHTVSDSMAAGVEHFAVVHDSYGTLPADMEILSRMTRQSFVKLYTNHDVAQELFDQFNAQTKKPLPPLPPFGQLDVAAVLVSKYFFV